MTEIPHPQRSRKLGNVARSGKRHSKAWQKVYRKYFGLFFAKANNDVTRGHQRSNFTVVRLRPTFPDKWRRSSWTIKVRRARKENIRYPFYTSFVACSQIWPQVNGLASRGHGRSNWPNFEDFVFYHNFELRKSTSIILPPLYSAFQDASNDV